jgi:hypothetical protein
VEASYAITGDPMIKYWVIVMLSSGSGTGDYISRQDDLPVFPTYERCMSGLHAYEQGLKATYQFITNPSVFLDHMPKRMCKSMTPALSRVGGNDLQK